MRWRPGRFAAALLLVSPVVHAAPKVAPAPSVPAKPQAALKQTGAVKVQAALRMAWGSGPGQLGHTLPVEANPEGPMSFDVDNKGRVYVLDNVNGRVQVFEPGGAARVIPLPAQTFQDLVVGDDGGVVLFDGLTTESLAFVDRTGRIDHEVPVAGRHVARAALVTGLFRREDGYWVEYLHDTLVRVADADGRPDAERPMVKGRPRADGRELLWAKLRKPFDLDLAMRPADSTAKTPAIPLATVHFPLPIWVVNDVSGDARGTTYVTADILEEGPAPDFAITREEVQIVALDKGTEVGRAVLPSNAGPEEQFRTTRLGGDGALYHLHLGVSGATLWRITR